MIRNVAAKHCTHFVKINSGLRIRFVEFKIFFSSNFMFLVDLWEKERRKCERMREKVCERVKKQFEQKMCEKKIKKKNRSKKCVNCVSQNCFLGI